MWQVYALMAHDIAREREREARSIRLAREAADFTAAEARRHGIPAGRRMGGGRRLVAAGLRGVEAGAGSLARLARSTATRVEGRVA